jgi:hypothetical protein
MELNHLRPGRLHVFGVRLEYILIKLSTITLYTRVRAVH